LIIVYNNNNKKKQNINIFNNITNKKI